MVSKLLLLFLSFVLCGGVDVEKLKLKQVLIFGRHNVRYPLGTELHSYSSKPWPQPDGKLGFLTPKGALLEGYMGEYFSQWFKNEQFLPEGCPKEDTVYVYANTAQRTKATARAFLDSAFNHCNVTVHHKNTVERDPNFEPVIHNTTEAYKEFVFQEIYRKIQNNLILKAGYSELNKILDIKESEACKKHSICDLTELNDSISYKIGEQVWVNGALRIANSAVDSFIMNYYNGLPLQDIGWGQITTPETWKLLVDIGRQDQMIRYSTVADDIGALLVNYLTKTFKNYNKMPKLMMIVGHDYNINSVTTTLGLRLKELSRLPNHYEKYPIGGKVVFQRWTDGKNDYLKIEYVYATWSQIRDATKLCLENPPGRIVMQLNWCNTDENGFCDWNEFVKKL